MNRALVGLLGFALWVAVGCSLDVVSVSVTEQVEVGMAGMVLPSTGFGGNLRQAISEQSVDPADVDSLKIQEASLTMLSQGGLTEDLAFLRDLLFELSADGLEPTYLARQASFAAGTRRAELEVNRALELRTYLDAGGVVLSVSGRLEPPPPDRVELSISLTFRLDADVI